MLYFPASGRFRAKGHSSPNMDEGRITGHKINKHPSGDCGTSLVLVPDRDASNTGGSGSRTVVARKQVRLFWEQMHLIRHDFNEQFRSVQAASAEANQAGDAQANSVQNIVFIKSSFVLLGGVSQPISSWEPRGELYSQFDLPK